MDCYTFTQFSKLSGLVPLVGVNSGRCFAGNTALLACCDVIIATANSTIGMGRPAMIEGGGLGIYTPEEVGPMSIQVWFIKRIVCMLPGSTQNMVPAMPDQLQVPSALPRVAFVCTATPSP